MRHKWVPPASWVACLLSLFCLAAAQDRLDPKQSTFRFAILGDRTGETVPGVFEGIVRETAAEHPAFVLTPGDTIQGGDDATIEREWRDAERILAGFGPIPLYLAAGNHDIWSTASAKAFRTHAKHEPHYSFDNGPVHVTVLDNSQSDDLAAEERAFLEKDLAAHASQPLKLVVSHRPSWLFAAGLGNPNFELHRIAKKYGVQYVVAGHLHKMARVELEGITYLSMPSSGGHLRASERYEEGWFYGHALVEWSGPTSRFLIEEARAPFGKARVSDLTQWSLNGWVGTSTKTR